MVLRSGGGICVYRFGNDQKNEEEENVADLDNVHV
jgi:hypothetical protein